MALPNLPQSRNEKYLAKIAGQEVELPNEPLSREEQYLDYIAKNGGGGGSYVLPTATELRLGGVKIGSGISVEEDGTISADIPTKVSELDNDEDFISDADYVHTDNNYDNTAKGIVNGVTEALAGKQDELTFDNIPTEDSTNPVKSGGVYSSDEAIRQWTTAEAKSVSGNPIVITDGSARNAEGLSVTCNPKQNLHGYDHPWAGGAGKNLLNTGVWQATKTIEGVITATRKSDGSYSIVGGPLPNAQWLTISSNNDYYLDVNLPSDTYTINANGFRFYINDESVQRANAYTFIGAITNIRILLLPNVTYNDTLKVQIEKGSQATTWTPYSNECPITGLTECVVDRDGKNLLALTVDGIKAAASNASWVGNKGTLDGVEFEILTDSDNNVTGISATRVAASSGNVAFNIVNKSSLMPLVGKSVIMNGVPSTASADFYLQFYLYDGTNQIACVGEQTSAFTPQNFANSTCVRIIVRTNANPNKEIFTPMIRLASVSDATYVPYSHDTATITFGQTVYGGSVDFKTGVVKVTHKFKQFDGSESWNENTNGYLITRSNGGFTDIKIASSANTPIITNMFQNGSTTWTNGKAGVDNGTLWIGDANQSTYGGLDAFKTFLSNNNLQMAYPLETPTELTLTPAELELLKGYNYITTNGTTIALDYLPDSLLAEAENYVDAKIPPAPSSDGTYVLTCTVTDGTPAYTWESAT